MPAISIPCPSCKAALRLPDTSLIGKQARCPRCQHRFLVTQPDLDEVPLQLADSPAKPAVPMVGTSARWVPDELPVFPRADASVIDGALLPFPTTTPVRQATTVPAFQILSDGDSSAPEHAFALPTDGGAERVTDRLSTRRRKQNKAGLWMMAGTAVIVLGIVIGGFLYSRRNADNFQANNPAPAPNPGWEAEKAQQAASNESAETLSPTSGKNIPLDYLPFTPHVLCHLRPMELWKKDRSTGEFQAMLGDLGVWLTNQIKLRTRFEPEDIAELTIAINFGSRMSVPDVAAVVRLREPQAESELMKRFSGRLRPDPEVEVYESADFSYLMIDRQTFAVAPLSMSEELAESKAYPALASPDMEPLIQASDRDRHLTLMFDLKILDSHREDIFIDQMRNVVDEFILWMGNGVETVSWSLHLEPHFYMETLLHQSTDSTAVKVRKHARLQLSRLAETILGAVKRMNPSTVGSRQMIGRFPAMLQAVDVGTTVHAGPAYARLVTLLPKNAAASLAAGALLTWNQSLLTNFEEDSKLTDSGRQAFPDKIVDRLQMKILVDFRRMPLQEAFAFIGESIKTEVSIDGDALKGAGFTQNMPQTLDLGTTTALAAVNGIIQKYAAEKDPLVLIVDEAGKKLLLSTKSKAETDGLTVFNANP